MECKRALRKCFHVLMCVIYCAHIHIVLGWLHLYVYKIYRKRYRVYDFDISALWVNCVFGKTGQLYTIRIRSNHISIHWINIWLYIYPLGKSKLLSNYFFRSFFMCKNWFLTKWVYFAQVHYLYLLLVTKVILLESKK